MGIADSRTAPCPFSQHLQHKCNKARAMRYTRGKSSDFYTLCATGRLDEIVEILTKDSASIDELNRLQQNGSTPLHAATFYNHLDIVKLLLERDCLRTALNRFGSTAYQEAQTDEMKQLFIRPDSTDRFHETDARNTISMYLPEENIEGVNASKAFDYVHAFRTQSEILEYSLNQQTTAMWLKFYNWFANSFPTLLERDDLHVNAFDLGNHPDFKQFLKRSLSDPQKYNNTMKSVNEAKQRNSIEPLITLYTSEAAGFYRPFNQLLAQPSEDTKMSPHLCDRFIIEFHIHRYELKQRAFTGITYRGATIAVDDLIIYRHALNSESPGVIGLKTFTSTSADPLVALQFAFRGSLTAGQKHVLFVFEITEVSSTIFGVSDLSHFGQEEEVLILPGNLFFVTNIQEQSNPPMTRICLRHFNVPVSFWQKIKQTIRSGKKSVL